MFWNLHFLKPAGQPACQPASQPDSQPANQPTKLASRQTSRQWVSEWVIQSVSQSVSQSASSTKYKKKQLISTFVEHASYIVLNRSQHLLPAKCFFGSFLFLGCLRWVQDDVTTFFWNIPDAGHILCHVIGQISKWGGTLGKNLEKKVGVHLTCVT